VTGWQLPYLPTTSAVASDPFSRFPTWFVRSSGTCRPTRIRGSLRQIMHTWKIETSGETSDSPTCKGHRVTDSLSIQAGRLSLGNLYVWKQLKVDKALFCKVSGSLHTKVERPSLSKSLAFWSFILDVKVQRVSSYMAVFFDLSFDQSDELLKEVWFGLWNRNPNYDRETINFFH